MAPFDPFLGRGHFNYILVTHGECTSGQLGDDDRSCASERRPGVDLNRVPFAGVVLALAAVMGRK